MQEDRVDVISVIEVVEKRGVEMLRLQTRKLHEDLIQVHAQLVPLEAFGGRTDQVAQR